MKKIKTFDVHYNSRGYTIPGVPNAKWIAWQIDASAAPSWFYRFMRRILMVSAGLLRCVLIGRKISLKKRKK